MTLTLLYLNYHLNLTPNSARLGTGPPPPHTNFNSCHDRVSKTVEEEDLLNYSRRLLLSSCYYVSINRHRRRSFFLFFFILFISTSLGAIKTTNNHFDILIWLWCGGVINLPAQNGAWRCHSCHFFFFHPKFPRPMLFHVLPN